MEQSHPVSLILCPSFITVLAFYHHYITITLYSFRGTVLSFLKPLKPATALPLITRPHLVPSTKGQMKAR